MLAIVIAACLLFVPHAAFAQGTSQDSSAVPITHEELRHHGIANIPTARIEREQFQLADSTKANVGGRFLEGAFLGFAAGAAVAGGLAAATHSIAPVLVAVVVGVPIGVLVGAVHAANIF